VIARISNPASKIEKPPSIRIPNSNRNERAAISSGVPSDKYIG
jgi:hypothetical protein